MSIIIAVLLLLVVFLLLFVILTFFLLAFDVFLDLPYVATDRKKIATIIKFVQIKKAKGPEQATALSLSKGRRGQTVIDLGSGDGRLLIAAAKVGARAIGYELNPLLIMFTLIHAKLEGVANNVQVYKKSLWQSDLAVADVIFVYAFKKSMRKFEDFVWRNSQKGTRIVVNTNPFPNKKPVKSENGIFLYKV